MVLLALGLRAAKLTVLRWEEFSIVTNRTGFAISKGTATRLALVILVALGLAACEPNNQGYAPTQPIQYSHAVHAGALKIPCQYCHFGAERGRWAGIPPAQICMNCHAQVLKDHPEVMRVKKALADGEPIRWVRIHNLPDHVSFFHRPHVKAGVVCQTCHGPVESMGRVMQFAPLTMGWCIECHRRSGGTATGGALAPPAPPVEAGTAPAVRANRLTDCSICHH